MHGDNARLMHFPSLCELNAHGLVWGEKLFVFILFLDIIRHFIPQLHAADRFLIIICVEGSRSL